VLSELFWRQRQMELYPNAFQINTGIPTPQEALITQQIDNVDEETKRNLVVNNLSKISDQEIANYIINKLTPDETTYVLNSFDKIKREIAKYYPKGLSKEDFVHFIQQQYFSKYNFKTNTYDKTSVPLAPEETSTGYKETSTGYGETSTGYEEPVAETPIKTELETPMKENKLSKKAMKKLAEAAEETPIKIPKDDPKMMVLSPVKSPIKIQ
jgi:hypothetical protein